MRIMLDMPNQTYGQLAKLAYAERRPLKNQAIVIIEQGLRDHGRTERDTTKATTDDR